MCFLLQTEVNVEMLITFNYDSKVTSATDQGV